MSARGLSRLGLALLLTAALVAAVVYRGAFNAEALVAWLRAAGMLAPLLFMLVYVLSAVLFLPAAPLALVGGALFGPWWGTFYSLTGATLGATAAFLIARYVAADWVGRKAGGRVQQLVAGVEAEGWRFVAFVRLVPLFPFNLLNYALGLTRIRLRDYVLASYVFMLPGAVAYTYLGYVGREAWAGGEGLMQKALLALGLLGVVGFLPGLVQRLRAGPACSVTELKRRLDANADIALLDVRSPAELHGQLGHIAGATNLPLDELPMRWHELAEHKTRTLAVICHTDRRSAQAIAQLRHHGFTRLLLVRGGMQAWNRAGLPVRR